MAARFLRVTSAAAIATAFARPIWAAPLKKPIYDPVEDEEGEFVYAEDPEPPLQAATYLIRSVVQSTHEFIKFNVQTTQRVVDSALATKAFITEVANGERNILFGDRFIPEIFILLTSGIGASLLARRSKNIALRWLLTPTVTLVTFRFAFPNLYEHTMMQFERALGFQRPTARGAFESVSSKTIGLFKSVRENRQEVKEEQRAHVSPTPIIEQEERVVVSDPETASFVIIESNGDLASSNKNENSNDFIPSVDQDDVMDMYNVRSAVIGTDKE